MVKIKLLLSGIFLLFSCQFVKSQDREDSIKVCIESQISNFFNSSVEIKEIDNTKFNELGWLKDSEVQSWLEFMSKDNLKIFKLESSETEYYVMIGRNTGATGLAINFWCYFVYNPITTKCLDFWSLHFSPKSVSLVNNTNIFNYISFNYSDSFKRYRDWDNISLKAEFYRFQENEKVLEKEIDEVCP